MTITFKISNYCRKSSLIGRTRSVFIMVHEIHSALLVLLSTADRIATIDLVYIKQYYIQNQ